MILEINGKKGILELKSEKSNFAICDKVFYRKIIDTDEQIEKIEFTFIDKSDISYNKSRKVEPNINFEIKRYFINLNADKLKGVKPNDIFTDSNLETLLNEILDLYFKIKDFRNRTSDCNIQHYEREISSLNFQFKKGEIDNIKFEEEKNRLNKELEDKNKKLEEDIRKLEDKRNNFGCKMWERTIIACNDYKGEDSIEVVKGDKEIKEFAKNIKVKYSELIKQIYNYKK